MGVAVGTLEGLEIVRNVPLASLPPQLLIQ